MDGRRFFSRAFRLFAYEGACRSRLQADLIQIQEKADNWKSRLNRRGTSMGERVEVGSSQDDLRNSPIADLIEFG